VYRFPLAARLPERERSRPESLGALLVNPPDGERIPLARLATLAVVEAPSTIEREWARRFVKVTCNVTDRDLGGFVEEAQRKVEEGGRPPSPPHPYHLGGGARNR